MSAKRIYHVSHGDQHHLVKAANKSQAIRHVAESTIKADVATQDQLVEMISAGMEVVEAGADKDPQNEPHH